MSHANDNEILSSTEKFFCKMNRSQCKQQLFSGSERSKESSFKFIRHELPTRMLNITQEFSSIPLDFSPMVQTVIDMYDESINDILPYTQG